MSLNFDNNDTPPLLPLFQIKTSTFTTPKSENHLAQSYANLKNVQDFFQKYSAITQSYLSGFSWHPDKKGYTYKNVFLSNQVNQINAIRASIHASEKLINKDPISAMYTLDTVINQVFQELNREQTANIGVNILNNILISMTADIQTIKNDINHLQEQIDPLLPKCKAKPIYIARNNKF